VLLNPGTTCWRVAPSPRAAVLVDTADYFDAARSSMFKARRSIHLLNWAFEAQTPFRPAPGGGAAPEDRIGGFLKDLAVAKPELDIRLLCWKSALPIAATQDFFPWRDRLFFAGSGVKFRLDGRLPMGACHHQKAIVIDDALAFCGGADFGPDRWDTPLHLDADPRRRKSPTSKSYFCARHEVMGLIEGPPAAALGELFRERWLRKTGESLPPAQTGEASDLWPDGVEPAFTNVAAGFSRTSAAWRDYPEVREVEALSLAMITGARRSIYMENQYFTSPVIAEALAARLAATEGPEVVIVSPRRSPSWFDQMTMDRTRSRFIGRLRSADVHGRFRAYFPLTAAGAPIIVHAKLAIIDDCLLRIGSANINNRSMGFDTECDLSLEAEGETAEASRTAIAAIRAELVGHWLGCPARAVAEAMEKEGGLGAAIEALRAAGAGRLSPIEPAPLGALATLIAKYHLGDPASPADSWRPWRRRAHLEASAEAVRARLAMSFAHMP